MTTRAPIPDTPIIGLLHPGAMGAAVGAVLVDGGHDVGVYVEDRSEATRRRADQAGLRRLASLDELVRTSDLIVSVVPPHAAFDVAQRVIDVGFDGTYLDANAISPERSRSIDELVTAAGAHYVDGGIVGRPPERAGTTWLHLSGQDAPVVAALFAGGALATNVVSSRAGDASAVKVAFAAWTKGSTALRTAVLAYAEASGVGTELETQWEAFEPGFWDEGRARAVSVTAKAWRFEGEMQEIADAFAAVGVPSGFHRAAAELYASIASLRDESDVDVARVVGKITGRSPLG